MMELRLERIYIYPFSHRSLRARFMSALHIASLDRTNCYRTRIYYCFIRGSILRFVKTMATVNKRECRRNRKSIELMRRNRSFRFVVCICSDEAWKRIEHRTE